MGKLFYGNTTEPIEIPDRVLAHVKVVVATKLRRGESFTLSWRHEEDTPRGRSTIWIQPSIPLRFVFSTEEPELLDPQHLKRLSNEASSSSGLTVDFAQFDDEVVEQPREKTEKPAEKKTERKASARTR